VLHKFDIDDILIVQYTEEAQYIGELHANGLLENATLEKVPETLTTERYRQRFEQCQYQHRQ
jgi:hypothetical protein